MRNTPQTLISAVREAVSTWRKRERLGIAAVVENIVETHNRLGLDVVTELTFESDRDAHRRMQTNGDRVMRWLDDETKAIITTCRRISCRACWRRCRWICVSNASTDFCCRLACRCVRLMAAVMPR